MNDNKQTSFKSVQLTPGQEIEVNQEGRFFYVDSCDGDVSASFDDGSKFKIRAGTEIQNGDFKKFRLISNVGSGGANVIITFYAGTLLISNRSPLVYTRPAPTYIIPLRQTIANLASYTIPNTNTRTGQPTADKQVSVRIQNVGGGAGNFDILLSALACANISADGALGDTIELVTPDAVTIYANGGGTVGILVLYALPT